MEGPPYCTDLWEQITTLTENLNWYDLYRKNPSESPLSAEERIGKTVIGGVEKEYTRGFTVSEYTPWLKDFINPNKPEHVMAAPISDYLNQANVRKSLHIDDAVQPWNECVRNANWTYAYSREASQWIYPILK